jgi:hypothetical protein
MFLGGALAVLTGPALLLPLLALGLLLSLWQRDGLLRAWPVFLVAQVAGLVLAPLAGPAAAPPLIAGGVLVAVSAALNPRVPAWLAYLSAVICGIGALAVVLEGHGFLDLPWPAYAGLLFGVNLAAALTAGLSQAILVGWPGPAARIALRVAASWIGAILLLSLAFELSLPLS